MGLPSRTIPGPRAGFEKSQDLIETASKAIFDEAVNLFRKELAASEAKLLVQFGKMLETEIRKAMEASQLEGRVEGRFKGLSETLTGQVKSFQERTDLQADRHELRFKGLLDSLEKRHSQQMRELAEVYEKRLSDLRAEHKSEETALVERVSKMLEGEICKRLDAFSGQSAENLEALHKAFSLGQESSMSRIKALIASLPQPQITFQVPEGAIKMLPSQVHVDVHPTEISPVFNVPEQKALELVVPEKAFNLHVETPPVMVNVPEQPAPKVDVIVPKPRLLKKKHYYNEFGQPDETIESEIE